MKNMTKAVDGKEIKRSFERDGITYNVIGAQVNDNGDILAYTYSASPDRLLVVFDMMTGILAKGFLAGCIIATAFCIWAGMII